MAATHERGGGGTTHHLSHEHDDETSLSERIVAAIAEYEDTDVASLPSLERSINPDALDELFDTASDDTLAPGCVTFSYYGYTVVVQSTGQVLIRSN